MSEEAKQGQEGAHTLENSGAKPLNPALEAALGQFDSAVSGADVDLFSLLEHSVERDADDSLAKLAKSVTEPRKGAGRPKGSTNRRNIDTFDWLEAHGHRSPEYTLSLIQTIDPRQLAVMMRRHKHFATALSAVASAAAALLPYKLAKKSPDVVAPPEVARPVIVFNQFNGGKAAAQGGGLSLGRVIENDGE